MVVGWRAGAGAERDLHACGASSRPIYNPDPRLLQAPAAQQPIVVRRTQGRVRALSRSGGLERWRERTGHRGLQWGMLSSIECLRCENLNFSVRVDRSTWTLLGKTARPSRTVQYRTVPVRMET